MNTCGHCLNSHRLTDLVINAVSRFTLTAAFTWTTFLHLFVLEKWYHSAYSVNEYNRPYRLFTFDPMASFPCLPVLARQACAWRLHLMFPARICCFLILSPITNLSLNVLCTKHEDWCRTKTRLLGQKWINGKVYCSILLYML